MAKWTDEWLNIGRLVIRERNRLLKDRWEAIQRDGSLSIYVELGTKIERWLA